MLTTRSLDALILAASPLQIAPIENQRVTDRQEDTKQAIMEGAKAKLKACAVEGKDALDLSGVTLAAEDAPELAGLLLEW